MSSISLSAAETVVPGSSQKREGTTCWSEAQRVYRKEGRRPLVMASDRWAPPCVEFSFKPFNDKKAISSNFKKLPTI